MSSGGRFSKSAGDPREEPDLVAADGVFSDDSPEQNPVPGRCFLWRDTMVSPYHKCTSWMHSVRGALVQCTSHDSSSSTTAQIRGRLSKSRRIDHELEGQRNQGLGLVARAAQFREGSADAGLSTFVTTLIIVTPGAQSRAASSTGRTIDEPAGATE
jgi:hypothetical protein